MTRCEIDATYPGAWLALTVLLHARDKRPVRAGWNREADHAYTTYGENQRAYYLERAYRWVNEGGNLGLALPRYTIALDVDKSAEAVDALRDRLADYPTQLTRNGVHILASMPIAEPLGNRYAGIPVTVRKFGNQIAVWPSIHESGFAYQWETELPLHPEALPELDPLQLSHETESGQHIRRRHGEGSASYRARLSEAWLEDLLDPDRVFHLGERHEALLFYCWHLIVNGEQNPDRLVEKLWEFADHRCHWSDRRPSPREIQDIVRGGLRRRGEWHE